MIATVRKYFTSENQGEALCSLTDCSTHQIRVLAGLHQGAPQGGLGGDHEAVAAGHPRLLLLLGLLLRVGLGVGVEVDRVVLAEVAEALGQLGPLVLGGVLGGGQH